MVGGAMMGRGGPPPGYDSRYYGGLQGREQSPGPYPDRMRDVSPPMPVPQDAGPVGEAFEMGGRSGPTPQAGPSYGLRDSDGDVQGMVALQQQQAPLRGDPANPISPSSTYSNE